MSVKGEFGVGWDDGKRRNLEQWEALRHQADAAGMQFHCVQDVPGQSYSVYWLPPGVDPKREKLWPGWDCPFWKCTVVGDLNKIREVTDRRRR